MAVYWRGAYLDERTAAMMDAVVSIVGKDVNVRPTQGSYSGGVSASGGTHDGGGAIDLAGQDAGMTQADREAIRDAGRQVGFAMWIRDPSQSDWPWHVHGIAVQPGGKSDRGCLSGAAHDQVIDYYEGRNGLASNAPDDGPRDWVGVTWETYEQTMEDDMPSIEEFRDLYRGEGMSGSGDPNFNGNALVKQAISEQYYGWRSEGISGAADPAHNGTQLIVDAINRLSEERRPTKEIALLMLVFTACLLLVLVGAGVVIANVLPVT